MFKYIPILSLCLVVAMSGLAAGQTGQLPYTTVGQSIRLKPSDVALPEGVAPGEYRRSFQPFENWTLICDENLKKKQKICNISQTSVDANDVVVFSWSLAATKKGDPLMILRVPAGVGKDSDISVKFPGRGALLVKVSNCNQSICLAMMPVNAVMRAQIAKATSPEISYRIGSEDTAFTVPLKGLTAALSAIN